MTIPCPVAIEVSHLTKRFTVKHRSSSLKLEVMNFFQKVRKRSVAEPQRVENDEQEQSRDLTEEFLALNDISFDVPHGETVAVIGRNGSGKSTLLQILARVYKATSGTVRLLARDGSQARIAPLLSLDAGFHPELTGLENIEFYGAMLGMSPRIIKERAGAIVAFAELEKKVDTPLRGWNDGAKLRLGFSIAVHTDPDILLVDEVMAVGDESFQNKCYRLIADLQEQGKTILFVSHDLAVVERVASRVIWLNQGVIHRDGDVRTVMVEYRNFSEQSV